MACSGSRTRRRQGIIEDDWSTLDSLKDAGFRAAGFGRFEWTVEGETYAKQYQPPSLVDMGYPPEHLVAEMDYADVQWALLHKFAGTTNEYMAECVQRFPNRLRALANVEEWLVSQDPDAAISKVRHAIEDLAALRAAVPVVSDGSLPPSRILGR